MTKMSKKWSCALLLAMLNVAPGRCNTDSRNWVLASGETIPDAELVNYDLDQDRAILRTRDDKERVYRLDDFSAIDAAWLLEWTAVSAELDHLAQMIKGEFRHLRHKGTYPADVYVYTPSKHRETKTLPMLFLFHPGGKGARYVKQFIVAAEALDLIVVSSDAFRNSGAVWNEKDEAMLACFKELLPDLDKTVPHDPNQFYMGGSSGGAQEAYHFSARIDHPCAGIFSNGGWIGGPDYYDVHFPRGMRVVMVNGHNDPASRWIERDAAVLEKRGCSVNVFAFEGGHQVPPPKTQSQALAWLIHGDPETTTTAQPASSSDSQ